MTSRQNYTQTKAVRAAEEVTGEKYCFACGKWRKREGFKKIGATWKCAQCVKRAQR